MIKYIVICLVFIFNISIFAQDENLIIQEGVYKDLDFMQSVKLNTVPFFNPELLNRAYAVYTYDFADVENLLELKFKLDSDIIEVSQLHLTNTQVEALLVISEKSYSALNELVQKTRDIVSEHEFENIYKYIQFTDETLNLMVQNGEIAIAIRDDTKAYTVQSNENFIKNIFMEIINDNELILVHKKDSFKNITSNDAIITWDAQESVVFPAKSSE